jgi:hypothetical protein
MKIIPGNKVDDSNLFQLKSFHDNNRSKSLSETRKYYAFLRKKGFKDSDIVVSERLRPNSGLFEVAVKKNSRTMKILRDAQVGEIY